MNCNKNKIVLVILLVILLPLSSFVASVLIPPLTTTRADTLTPPGWLNFVEDFTTTTYRDPISDAWGWGTGTVTNARDYASPATFLDYVSTSDPVVSVDVQGRKAYIATYNPAFASAADNIQIFDLTDLTDIIQLDSLNVAGRRVVKVDGDALYCGSSNYFVPVPPNYRTFLTLYNVTDPYNISTFDSTYWTDDEITGIDVQGHYAYVAKYGSPGEFLIFDVEDPTNIQQTFSQGWTNLLGIDVVGRLSYMAHGTYGLKIRNVSDPYNANVAVGSVNTPGNATAVLVDGSLAYVADGPSGVQIIDVSDPTAPTIIGSYDTPGDAQNLELQGKTLYVADGSGGVQVLDVSNPRDPQYVTQTPLVGGPIFWFPFPYTYDVALYGGALIIGSAWGLYAYRFDSSTPDLEPYSNYSDYDCKDVAVQGDVAYMVGTDGLTTVNVSDPAVPVFLDNIAVDSTVDYVSVDVQGDVAYVLERGGAEELITFDVSDPSNIVLLDRLIELLPMFPLDMWDICVEGEVAYIADGTEDLMVYNVSDPANLGPFIDQRTDGDDYRAVTVQGHTVYAASSFGTMGPPYGVFVYNSYDLSNLALTDRTYHTDIHELDVDGDWCAMAYGTDGIWFLNVTNPNDLTGLMFYDPDNYEWRDVALFGPYALACGSNGLRLINATEYPYDQIRWYVWSGQNARRLTIHGDFAYIADTNSLRIYRFCSSAGNTWEYNTDAQSLTIDTTPRIITKATLTRNSINPPGTNINYYMTADGGANWESVTPGVEHTFANPGSDLRWRASLFGLSDRTPKLTQVTIDYYANELPTTPALTDPGDHDEDGDFTVSWGVSTDDGSIDHYELQMSDSNTFAVILDSWTPTGTSQAVTGLAHGRYYFRVRAVDNLGESGAWSIIHDIMVNVPPTTPTLTDPGTTDDDGAFTVSWGTSTDTDGSVDHYELQMSDSNVFTTILDSWTPSGTSQPVSGLADGTYYFRVRAVDNDGLAGSWSSVESITVETPVPPPPPIPGFPIEAIALGIIITLVVGMIVRRRRRK